MTQSGIEQAREIILSSEPTDTDARRSAWGLLLENDALVGRLRMSEAAEGVQKSVMRSVIAGEDVYPTTRSAWTLLPQLILQDDELVQERLGLTPEDLAKAKPFIEAMINDL